MPYTETAELVIKSRVDGVESLNALVEHLRIIEAAVNRINDKGITVQSQSASVSGINAQTSAIRGQIAAVEELNLAMAGRTTRTSLFEEGKKTGGGSSKVVSSPSVGVKVVEKFRTVEPQESSKISKSVTTDLDKIAAAQKKAVAAWRKNNKEARDEQNKQIDDSVKGQQFMADRAAEVARRRAADADSATAGGVDAASRANKAAKIRRARSQEREDEARNASVEAATRSNRAAAIRRQRAEEQADESRSASVEAATRSNKAAAMRRSRADERAEEARQASVEQATRNNRAAALRRERQEARDAAFARTPGQVLKRTLAPEHLLSNAAKFASWMGPILALRAAFDVAGHSMQKFIDVGGQTARLDQVFRGVGGSAQQLTDDVLRLAAANGVSTKEAMDSAIQWSRLGLNRLEVNEAVRVSMVAANVAEVTTAEATHHLAAVMQVYSLRVGQLDGVLGMLNQSSNTYNVTNKDLLEGLSRVAAVAQQAGLSLAETQGILTASVSKTGQSGTQMGNALKSILVAFSNPEIQGFLRGKGVELTSGNGDLKGMSQVLRELFVAYQGLTEAERKELTVRVAGKTQANRFVAIMESYVEAQKAAIAAQLNLNSAQNENEKILGTLKSRLAGVVSEWDRFVAAFANDKTGATGVSLNEALSGTARTLKNIIKLYNDANAEQEKFLSKQKEDKDQSETGKARRLLIKTAGIKPRKNIFTAYNEFAEGEDAVALEGFSREADEKKNQIAALNARKILLGETLPGALQNAPADRQQSMVRGVLPGSAGKELESLVRQGDLAGAIKLLREGAARAEKEISLRLWEQTAILDSAVGILQKQNDELAGVSGNEKEISKNNELIVRFKEQQAKLVKEAKFDDLDQLRISQQQLTVVEAQKQLQENIAGLYRVAPAQAQTGKLNEDFEALHAQAEQLAGAILRMGGDNNFTKDVNQWKEDLANVQAQMVAIGSASNRAFKKRADRAELVGGDAQNRIGGFNVGGDDTAKLENRIAELRKMVAQSVATAFSTNGQTAQDAITSGLHAINALEQSLNDKAALRVKLNTDLKNLILEQKKIHAESLLMAGPGDLLRKLSVKKMVDRNGGKMGLGDFMGMSTQGRQDALDYTGGFARRNLENQINRIGPADDINRRVGEQNGLERTRRDLLERNPVPLHQGNDLILAAARGSADALHGLKNTAIQLAGAFESMQTVMGALGFFGGAAPSGPAVTHPVGQSAQGGRTEPRGASGGW